MKPGLTIALTLAVTVFTGSALLGQTSRTAEAQFKAAQNTEQVEGDRTGAIEQYKKLAQGSDRAVAAKAQARLAALQSPAIAAVGQTSRLIWSDRILSTSEVGPISADGRFLAFSDKSVTIVDLKEGKTRTLSEATLGDGNGYGWVEGSAISPDGRQVAYVLVTQVPAEPQWEVRYEVRVLQVNGGEAAKSRRVYMFPGARGMYLMGWSPEGKKVQVTRWSDSEPRGEIALVSIADGAVRVIQRAIDARTTFSPDGGLVAYSRSDSGIAGGLFVATMDGKETRIEVGPGRNRNPIWSRDGSHLLFESNRTGTWSLWMVPVAGGTPSGPARLVKEDLGPYRRLGLTREGALYYLGGRGTTNVYTAELDARRNATAAPATATNQYINSNRAGVWSPDGQNLAYLSATPRGGFIRVRSVTAGEDREVSSRIPISGPVRWFPDGQSLLVASRDARVLNGELGYYRMSVASGDAQLLHQTASRDVMSTRPDLSPDGKTIFYLESPGQAVRFDIESRRETRLTPVGSSLPSHNRPVSLAVSPDGTQIAYLAARLVVVAPATGGEAREVVRFSGGSQAGERAEGLGLAWSPDQRYLFFVRPGREFTGIWRAPLAGGEAENIGVSMGRIRALRVHPDGRRILFDSVVDPMSEVWALENFLPRPSASK